MFETFKLWENDIPFYIGGEEPKITYYKTTKKLGRGTVIICPGGAYMGRAPHEGEDYADFFMSEGLDAFVLDYRVSPNRYPAALSDIRRAIRFVRHNAEKFGIDPEKIAVMGSSAGGHLAAHAASFIGEIEGEAGDEIDRESYIPNGQILCYPVLDIEGHRGSFKNLLGDDKIDALADSITPRLIATDKTPPAFMWHTASDAGVNVCNTYRYASALKKLGIPVEMHIYPSGQHGLGLADRTDPFKGLHPNMLNNGRIDATPHVKSWSRLLVRWLRLFGFYR